MNKEKSSTIREGVINKYPNAKCYFIDVAAHFHARYQYRE